MAIYTKKGDRGETSLYDVDARKAKRISKSSDRIEAIGSIDEVNSLLGVAASFVKYKKTIKFIEDIQRDLLTIGSMLAGSKLKLSEDRVDDLEEIIDELEGKLPVLSNFILPGGSGSAAHLHQARCIVRRAERVIVKLGQKEHVDEIILMYINRLSDLLFMLAREQNSKAKVKDKIWKGK